MPKAVWKGQLIAESDDTIVVEGNHYFPPNSINKELLEDSTMKTVCPWKGQASYNSIKVGDEINEDAVWHYPNPKEGAKNIEGYYAFWRGVEVQ